MFDYVSAYICIMAIQQSSSTLVVKAMETLLLLIVRLQFWRFADYGVCMLLLVQVINNNPDSHPATLILCLHYPNSYIGSVSLFNGILTFMGYVMPEPLL